VTEDFASRDLNDFGDSGIGNLGVYNGGYGSTPAPINNLKIR